MSYKCEKCGKSVANGTRLTLIPVSYREKDYFNVVLKKANVKKKRYAYSPKAVEEAEADGWEVGKKTTTRGRELTGEIKCCPECLEDN